MSPENFSRTWTLFFLSALSPLLPREKPVVSWFLKGYKHKCRRSYFIQTLSKLKRDLKHNFLQRWCHFSNFIQTIKRFYIKHNLDILIESNFIDPLSIVRYPHKHIRTVPEKFGFQISNRNTIWQPWAFNFQTNRINRTCTKDDQIFNFRIFLNQNFMRLSCDFIFFEKWWGLAFRIFLNQNIMRSF